MQRSKIPILKYFKSFLQFLRQRERKVHLRYKFKIFLRKSEHMVSQALIMILFTLLIGYGGGVGMSWATHPVHILFSENFHFLSSSVVFFLENLEP